MRICVDISPAVHRRAGLGRYAQKLLEHLLRLDDENQYLVFYHQPRRAVVSPPLDSLPRLTFPTSAKPWRMSVLLAHFLRIPMDRLLPDVQIFHATDHLLPPLRRARTVFTIHDLIFRFYPQYHLPLNRWFLSLMIPRFLQAADAIIAISHHTKRDVMRLYGVDEAKIQVIHEGVDADFRPQPPERIAEVRGRHHLPRQYILYVGTIEPRKNLGALLEAYLLLKQRARGVQVPKLAIVGKKGWLYGGFFRRLRETGLEKETVLTGYVPDEDLPAIYSGALFFVYPSFYEGFGLPVLEAMACGVPVICSQASSLPEVAGEAALLVNPHDVGELAEAMMRLLTDEEMRRRLRGEGLKRAALFTWEEAARRTLRVYRRLGAALKAGRG